MNGVSISQRKSIVAPDKGSVDRRRKQFLIYIYIYISASISCRFRFIQLQNSTRLYFYPNKLLIVILILQFNIGLFLFFNKFVKRFDAFVKKAITLVHAFHYETRYPKERKRKNCNLKEILFCVCVCVCVCVRALKRHICRSQHQADSVHVSCQIGMVNNN